MHISNDDKLHLYDVKVRRYNSTIASYVVEWITMDANDIEDVHSICKSKGFSPIKVCRVR